jgi:hypothetical protein
MDLVEVKRLLKDHKDAKKAVAKSLKKLDTMKNSQSKWEVERAEKELFSAEEELSCLELKLANSWKNEEASEV